jgi:hypothetical protein
LACQSHERPLGDRCGNACRAQLADPITADRTRFLLNFLDKVDRYVSGDGVHQDRNAGEVLGRFRRILSRNRTYLSRLSHYMCLDEAVAGARMAK